MERFRRMRKIISLKKPSQSTLDGLLNDFAEPDMRAILLQMQNDFYPAAGNGKTGLKKRERR